MKIVVNVPQHVDIDSMELSALFSNAIENAYHACLNLPHDIDRYINVVAHYNGKRLSISVINPCNEEIVFEDGVPLSPYEGGGIGTRSMIYTVKRFQGAYTFLHEDGLFQTRLILNV